MLTFLNEPVLTVLKCLVEIVLTVVIVFFCRTRSFRTDISYELVLTVMPLFTKRVLTGTDISYWTRSFRYWQFVLNSLVLYWNILMKSFLLYCHHFLLNSFSLVLLFLTELVLTVLMFLARSVHRRARAHHSPAVGHQAHSQNNWGEKDDGKTHFFVLKKKSDTGGPPSKTSYWEMIFAFCTRASPLL